jgi:hypothetical protein
MLDVEKRPMYQLTFLDLTAIKEIFQSGGVSQSM